MPNMWIAKDADDKVRLAESSQPNLRKKLGTKVRKGKLDAGTFTLERISTKRVDNALLQQIVVRPEKVFEYLGVEVLDTKEVKVDEDGTVRGKRGG